MTQNEIKQVICIRRDLKMRRGKEIAQGAHASIAFLTNKLRADNLPRQTDLLGRKVTYGPIRLSKEEAAWIEGIFTKIVVRVDSEEELRDVYQKALDAGLTAHLITDRGLTEFKDEEGNPKPTITCCGIGPAKSQDIDPITGYLELY